MGCSYGCGIEFSLITTFYNEGDLDRRNEYLECLSRNVENSQINKIYAFYENTPKDLPGVFFNNKVEIVSIKERPSFKQFFDFANQHLKGKLVIIANTDIYFDDTLKKLDDFDFTNHLMCLTRYNVYDTGWRRHIESHDSWIFRSPINIKIPDDVKIGYGACDIVIQRIACGTPGLAVSNPSLDIKTWHLHKSEFRNYAGACNHHYKTYRAVALPISHLPKSRRVRFILWLFMGVLVSLLWRVAFSVSKTRNNL